MKNIDGIKLELSKHADDERAKLLHKYFKAVPGGYGDGDVFIGVRVPVQHMVAKEYYQKISLGELELLLRDPVHEHRLTALFIMVNKFVKAKAEEDRRSIVDLYLNNLSYVNNWDLVDSSAHKILGAYILDKEKDILYDLAHSQNLWEQRVAVISTFHFINNNEYEDALRMAKLLINHEHDLIHKAVGWMLREIGNRDIGVEIMFLEEYYSYMPRTMLRYAIEKFEPDMRMKFLRGKV